ncbi:hypothetical protein ALC60_12399, partial [Trachymyrmex zeteki]
RIINFYSVFLTLVERVKCKSCGGNVEFEESSKRELGFKITIKCPSCAPKLILVRISICLGAYAENNNENFNNLI